MNYIMIFTLCILLHIIFLHIIIIFKRKIFNSTSIVFRNLTLVIKRNTIKIHSYMIQRVHDSKFKYLMDLLEVSVVCSFLSMWEFHSIHAYQTCHMRICISLLSISGKSKLSAGSCRGSALHLPPRLSVLYHRHVTHRDSYTPLLDWA